LSEGPRVLIGSPTYEGKEYCRKEFVENVKRLSYPHTFIMVDNTKHNSYAAKLRRDGVNVVQVPRGRNSRDALANASNYLRKRTLEGGYDYLLMLESDVFPPRDIIESLLKHMNPYTLTLQEGVRVVGAPYHISDGKHSKLCIFIPEKTKSGIVGTRMLTAEEEEVFLNGKLRRVHGMGVGCTLIHRSVLEEFTFWYSELDDDRMASVKERKHPDVYFYLDLHNNRIPVYCDTSKYAIHKPSAWSEVLDL
jgi:GT2 family glycosyltransferase